MTSVPPVQPPPGWYPQGPALRWWSGTEWGPFAPPQWPAGPMGPIGPPPTEEESGRNIAIAVELWPLAAVVASCFAFVLPLIFYLVQKDQNRFARWHAGEALNAALTTLLLAIPAFVGWIGLFAWWAPDSRDTDVGFPWPFFVGWGVLVLVGLIELGLGILGAVRASQGVWWRHPLAIPFVRAHRRDAPRPRTIDAPT